MAPVNDQITAMERCERAVDNVFARMQPQCFVQTTDRACGQFPVQSDFAAFLYDVLRAA